MFNNNIYYLLTSLWLGGHLRVLDAGKVASLPHVMVWTPSLSTGKYSSATHSLRAGNENTSQSLGSLKSMVGAVLSQVGLLFADGSLVRGFHQTDNSGFRPAASHYRAWIVPGINCWLSVIQQLLCSSFVKFLIFVSLGLDCS